MTPSGEKYRSVTTILSAINKEGIQQWRKKVGEQEANRIANKASTRGTKLHNMMEDYVGNKEDFVLNRMPTTLSLFLDLQPHIDNNIDLVYGIEYPLYSDQLRAAGTSDLICKYGGKNTIVDYKTSNKPKKVEWIKNYFIQSTAYSLMVKERYNLDIEQIVIMIAVDNDQPQIFVKDPNEFVEETIHIFNTY